MKLYAILCLIVPICSFCSEGYLEKKPDKSIIVPTTLTDLQALLDNNVDAFNIDPCLGFMGSDDYILSDENWAYLNTSTERNAYRWNADVYEGESVSDWNIPYRQIFYANVVLEHIATIVPDPLERTWADNIEGSALFYRSIAHYNLLQHFAPPYQEANAATQLGIPIRLSPNLATPIVRETLQRSYDQTVSDAKESVALLPAQSVFKTRPSKAAAYGLLARIYLVMGQYENAQAYADSSLQTQNSLLDYNTLDATKPRPIPAFHEEVIFHSYQITYGIRNLSWVNPEIILFYDEDDLRRKIFFTPQESNFSFKGWYTGQDRLFSGLATDEMYLIRAECLARAGNTESAMKDLNTLLEKRWLTGAFIPLTANDSDEALALIIHERRKELLYRNLRWSDLRRLQNDVRFASVLTRSLNGQTYSLPPNDLRYTYPIPMNEIEISGIEQNLR